MEKEWRLPEVVSFAYEIIEMYEELLLLREEVAHYKEMQAIYQQSLDNSLNSTMTLTGVMLKAALDPDSVINKGHEAILRDKITGGC